MSVTINPKHNIKPIIQYEEIQGKISDISKKISINYSTLDPLIICILDGAERFFDNLQKRIFFRHSYIKTIHKTYSDMTKDPSLTKFSDLDEQFIYGRHIILVDDIIDTGNCMDYFMRTCQENGCLSLKTCTLLNKESKRETGYSPDYNGFIIDDIFVVGYGMDYNDIYRDLDYIAELKINEDH